MFIWGQFCSWFINNWFCLDNDTRLRPYCRNSVVIVPDVMSITMDLFQLWHSFVEHIWFSEHTSLEYTYRRRGHQCMSCTANSANQTERLFKLTVTADRVYAKRMVYNVISSKGLSQRCSMDLDLDLGLTSVHVDALGYTPTPILSVEDAASASSQVSPNLCTWWINANLTWCQVDLYQSTQQSCINASLILTRPSCA